MRKLREYAMTLITAIIIALLINKFIIANAVVPTGSMEPTIMHTSSFIVDKISYKFMEPRRGDIIVFFAPDLENILYLKRIVALPGETIEGKDGEIYINNDKLVESYVADKISNDFGPYTVPDNEYFVLGDNRNYSLDARYWEDKYVNKSEIIGKALLEYIPEIELFRKVTYNID